MLGPICVLIPSDLATLGAILRFLLPLHYTIFDSIIHIFMSHNDTHETRSTALRFIEVTAGVHLPNAIKVHAE